MKIFNVLILLTITAKQGEAFKLYIVIKKINCISQKIKNNAVISKNVINKNKTENIYSNIFSHNPGNWQGLKNLIINSKNKIVV